MNAGWTVLVIVLWLVTLALVILVLGLSRRLQSLEGIVMGTDMVPVPSPGTAVNLSTLREAFAFRESARFAVLFLSAGCPHCRALVRDLTDSGQDIATVAGMPVLLVTDDLAAAPAALGEVVKDDGAISESFAIRAVPAVVGVNSDGMVFASGNVNSTRGLRELLWGEPAPRLEVMTG